MIQTLSPWIKNGFITGMVALHSYFSLAVGSFICCVRVRIALDHDDSGSFINGS